MSTQYNKHMKKRNTVAQCTELLVSRRKWPAAQEELLGAYFQEVWSFAKARAKKKALVMLTHSV